MEDSDAVRQPSQTAFDELSLWLEVADGKKKGRVYEMGSEVHIIFGSYHVLSPLPPPPPSPPPPQSSSISLAEQIQQAVSTVMVPFHHRLSAIEARLHDSFSSSPPSNPSDHLKDLSLPWIDITLYYFYYSWTMCLINIVRISCMNLILYEFNIVYIIFIYLCMIYIVYIRFIYKIL